MNDEELIEIKARLEKAEALLTDAHDLLNDIHGYDTEVYHAITDYFEEGE